MAVVLDSKDLAKIDKELVAGSQVWAPLVEYSTMQEITEADFVGVNEVRVNKMSGLEATTSYKRNDDNTRSKISMEKETRKLKQERWFAADLDMLDEDENGAYDVVSVVEQHTSLIAIPEKDTAAFNEIYLAGKANGKVVDAAVDSATVLEAYDNAENYFLAKGSVGTQIMFCSASYYKQLKNADKIARGLRLDDATRVQGLDRTVTMLDGKVPIFVVADDRMVTEDSAATTVEFILVGTSVCNPIEKLNTVDIVPASQDRDAYRDTVKTLNYYDNIILDNAAKDIYIHTSPVAGA